MKSVVPHPNPLPRKGEGKKLIKELIGSFSLDGRR